MKPHVPPMSTQNQCIELLHFDQIPRHSLSMNTPLKVTDSDLHRFLRIRICCLCRHRIIVVNNRRITTKFQTFRCLPNVTMKTSHGKWWQFLYNWTQRLLMSTRSRTIKQSLNYDWIFIDSDVRMTAKLYHELVLEPIEEWEKAYMGRTRTEAGVMIESFSKTARNATLRTTTWSGSKSTFPTSSERSSGRLDLPT